MDAIHSGALSKVKCKPMKIFNFCVPTSCPGVPKEILMPRKTWEDKKAFDRQTKELALMMAENFEGYSDQAGTDILEGGPQIWGEGMGFGL